MCDCDNGPVWQEHNTRGYLDGGPSCHVCGECECMTCEELGKDAPTECREAHSACAHDEHECIGLSFGYTCLDGGEFYCEPCMDKLNIRLEKCTECGALVDGNVKDERGGK